MPSMHRGSELVSPRQTPATEEAAEPPEPPARPGQAELAAPRLVRGSAARHHAPRAGGYIYLSLTSAVPASGCRLAAALGGNKEALMGKGEPDVPGKRNREVHATERRCLR